mmetsp:Transcript_20128/g.23869  ORF Transcript_20128/g.23869 Transcript_20128/m.23869 type:complete len:216 (+) Transcript_20128:66-713(+)
MNVQEISRTEQSIYSDDRTERTEEDLSDFDPESPTREHFSSTLSEGYVFSENDRAIHARHAEVAFGRQFVPRNALDFVTHYPATRGRGNVELALPIEDCFICRSRGQSSRKHLRVGETLRVDMASRISMRDNEKTSGASTNPEPSFAITKAVCDSQKLFKHEGEQPRPLSATTGGEGIDRLTHLVTRKTPGDALECTMDRLLRQTTPPTPHPPRF